MGAMRPTRLLVVGVVVLLVAACGHQLTDEELAWCRSHLNEWRAAEDALFGPDEFTGTALDPEESDRQGAESCKVAYDNAHNP